MSFCRPGPLGKALATATDLPINQRFRKITIGPDLPELTDEARNNLSTDQRYGYDIVMAVRSGVLPDRLVNLGIGPVNHSRWLTTANRFLRLWVSQHGFKGKELTNLKLICEFIVGVYYPHVVQLQNQQPLAAGCPDLPDATSAHPAAEQEGALPGISAPGVQRLVGPS